MSQPVTLILMGQTASTGQNSLLVGEKFPASGYYMSKKDLQTFTWKFTNVTGTLSFQATLAENPTDDDWFVAHGPIVATHSTENSYANVVGNFVWIRAVVTDFSSGTIQHIKASY